MCSIAIGCIWLILPISWLLKTWNDYYTPKRGTEERLKREVNELRACIYAYFSTSDFHRPPCGQTGAGRSSAETLLQWPISQWVGRGGGGGGGLKKQDLLLVFLKLLIMNSSSRSYREACGGFPWLHRNVKWNAMKFRRLFLSQV